MGFFSSSNTLFDISNVLHAIYTIFAMGITSVFLVFSNGNASLQDAFQEFYGIQCHDGNS